MILSISVRGINFFYKSGMFFIQLPSGRRLSYVKPRISTNQFGGESATYEGVGSTKKWEYPPTGCRISRSAPTDMRHSFTRKIDINIAASGSSPETAMLTLTVSSVGYPSHMHRK